MLKIPFFFVRSVFIWLFAGGLFVLTAGPAAFAQGQPQPVSDELLVGFRGGVSPAQGEAVYRGHGASKIEELSKLNVHRIKVAPSAIDAIERALAKRPEVKFVERNQRHAPDFIPNDPSYGSQWHLPKIHADLAWEFTRGDSDVIIAILDSGVDPTHADLSAKLIPGRNFFDNNTNTTDVFGHGTMVAGAAAAICNNGLGVAAPGCQNLIMPIRVTDTAGYGYTSAIANGLRWAVDNGARVMNLSFANMASSSTIQSAAQYVRDHGGVVVAAAGNSGTFESTPENPYIVSVSATTSSDTLASWSSRGNYIDVSAPGASIYTTKNGGGYGSVSGTSFSSPITAGVVALIMSVNPSLSPTEVENVLESNADDLGTAGFDTNFGHGRVNAYLAVSVAATTAPAPDTTSPTVSISSPANGSNVKGGISVAVSASDDSAVSRVDLYVDGSFYASDTQAPFSLYWDTTGFADGSHSLVATAVDPAGNVGTSSTISVVVENAVTGDTLAPSVIISNPVSVVTGNKLVVSVSATDNVGVTKVELYLDGKLVGTDTSNPYSFTLNTRKLSKTNHTLQAKGYDAAGNVGLSTPVSFLKSAAKAKK